MERFCENIKFTFSIIAFVCLTLTGFAGETFVVRSKAMDKEVNNFVIKPSYYDKSATDKKYPVIYLLHGFGGDHSSWAGIKPNLNDLADKYSIIFVCPDGAKSWYWDSPTDSKSMYETYVSKELVEAVDAAYNTIKENKFRAITGLSMGGHGGLWIGIRHPDVFSNCGSMSGGVDIRPFKKNWQIEKSLCPFDSDPEMWNSHTVMNIVDSVKPNTLNMIIDCGTEDFFFEVNESLHKKMLELKIKHDYVVRPGAHDAKYWNNAVDYQILYFAKCFWAFANAPAEK